jgi:hypothetical protein
MQLRRTRYVRQLKHISIASVLVLGGLQPIIAQSAGSAVNARESQAREIWRSGLSNNPPSAEGCFHAAYPNLVWERVACSGGVPRVHPTPRMPGAGTAGTTGSADIVGNGRDWALGARGLITTALGGFLNVTNVKSEKGVGVASFGGGGILGANEYTLQLNSNANATTSVCAGHGGCTVWQQYLYATDFVTKGKAAVFIQYWLLNWGNSACPKGFAKSGVSCFKNSAFATAPNMKITQLGMLQLEGKAVPGGNDAVLFSNGTNIYSVTTKDSVLQLGLVWREAEFNVVGNAGGSRAVFNKGVSTDVAIEIADGSTAAPLCLAKMGTTGETNNLNLGNCVTAGGANPEMEFFEAN